MAMHRPAIDNAAIGKNRAGKENPVASSSWPEISIKASPAKSPTTGANRVLTIATAAGNFEKSTSSGRQGRPTLCFHEAIATLEAE
jgi:hypothetical protein